jgi:hypothetical protein
MIKFYAGVVAGGGGGGGVINSVTTSKKCGPLQTQYSLYDLLLVVAK